MTDTDIALRGILTALAFAAVILAGAVTGNVWHHRPWPIRVITVGGIGVLVYVLAGQAKAYLLDIPFDGFSWLGVAAYLILITGCAVHLRSDRRGR